MRRLFLLLGVGGVAYGLYAFYLKQLEILENLTYKLKGIKFSGISLSSTDVILTLEVVNNSDISITISKYYFDVYVNNIFIGVIQNANVNQDLKGLGGISTFNVKVRVKNSALIGSNLISGLRENFKNATIRLKGVYGLKKGFIKIKDLEVNETFKVKDFM
tara:strand:+ start:2698 stop:3180 length:483 start_codon:yes stop_codon:yes gene_type:complete